MSRSEDYYTVQGRVLKALPSAVFEVELENGHIINAYVSGKIRQNNIRILIGDLVDVEISVYDTNKGRVSYRYKNK